MSFCTFWENAQATHCFKRSFGFFARSGKTPDQPIIRVVEPFQETTYDEWFSIPNLDRAFFLDVSTLSSITFDSRKACSIAIWAICVIFQKVQKGYWWFVARFFKVWEDKKKYLPQQNSWVNYGSQRLPPKVARVYCCYFNSIFRILHGAR